ncbi:hypothetical protein OC834_007543 [Tilletia horrida]|nr:hypothetical protein OC834_007543 [Tilletia horrida]
MVDFDQFPISLQYVSQNRLARTAPAGGSKSWVNSPGRSERKATKRAKHGRLQSIPSHFCTRITAERVWERHFDELRRAAILDHTGPAPRLVLS